jgi:hypothetical protein
VRPLKLPNVAGLSTVFTAWSITKISVLGNSSKNAPVTKAQSFIEKLTIFDPWLASRKHY